MRVVVVSDTHLRAGRPLPAAVLAAVEGSDAVLHAGDITSVEVLDQLAGAGPVHAVLGNNDVDLVGLLPERLELDLGGVAVAMIHDSGPSDGRPRRLKKLFPHADLVVFGHSHLPFCGPGEDGQLLLNPGSPTQRRRAPTHTFAEVDVADGRIIDVRLVALGP